MRYRQQLVAQRRNSKLRISALLRENRIVRPGCRPWTIAWNGWLATTDQFDPQTRWVVDQQLLQLRRLQEDIRTVERRLQAVTADDPVMARLGELPGVGLITAVTLRAEIGRFDRFHNGKQLARFCGLSPCNASSGQRQADAGLVKAGNRELRAVLIELGHRLIRYEPRWQALASRMTHTGKAKCVIVAAVANRWTRWLYWQMQQAA